MGFRIFLHIGYHQSQINVYKGPGPNKYLRLGPVFCKHATDSEIAATRKWKRMEMYKESLKHCQTKQVSWLFDMHQINRRLHVTGKNQSLRIAWIVEIIENSQNNAYLGTIAPNRQTCGGSVCKSVEYCLNWYLFRSGYRHVISYRQVRKQYHPLNDVGLFHFISSKSWQNFNFSNCSRPI